MSTSRIAFLDRDGTILKDKGYLRSIADCQFLPGAIEGLLALQQADFQLAIVSNQSGVARGYLDRAAVENIHAWLREQLCAAGITVAALAYCPHGAWECCSCRKPKVGLAQQVVDQLGKRVDFSASWTIGDKPSDVKFGQRLQTKTVLLKSAYWGAISDDLDPDHIAESLQAAATMAAEVTPTKP